MDDSGTALEQRVAALEAAVDRLLVPVGIVSAPEADLTPGQVAELQKALDEFAAHPVRHFEHRILPSPPNLLDPETVRQLLRESVTVIKPGEVLFFTAGDPNWTPAQLREIQDVISAWLEYNAPDVKVLVLPHGKMAAAGPGPDFMKDVRTDVYRHERVESVKLTHLPTGTVAVAPSRDEAVAKLALALAARGDITINDGRRALGLPEWDMAEADTAQALPSA